MPGRYPATRHCASRNAPSHGVGRDEEHFGGTAAASTELPRRTLGAALQGMGERLVLDVINEGEMVPFLRRRARAQARACHWPPSGSPTGAPRRCPTTSSNWPSRGDAPQQSKGVGQTPSAVGTSAREHCVFPRSSGEIGFAGPSLQRLLTSPQLGKIVPVVVVEVVPVAVVPGGSVVPVVVGAVVEVVPEVVDVVPEVVEVVPIVVVVAELVVVVLATVVVVTAPGSPTVIGGEVPDAPVALSVTWSGVVSGSTRVTSTLAKPSTKVTLLPVAQSPCEG